MDLAGGLAMRVRLEERHGEAAHSGLDALLRRQLRAPLRASKGVGRRRRVAVIITRCCARERISRSSNEGAVFLLRAPSLTCAWGSRCNVKHETYLRRPLAPCRT
jgi:hypothetical protein